SSKIGTPAMFSGGCLIVSGLSPGAIPASIRTRCVAVCVQVMVLSCVGHLTSCAASGDMKRSCDSQCGSSLRWYAYQPEIFCFAVGAYVRRMLLSAVHVPANACRVRSGVRT